MTFSGTAGFVSIAILALSPAVWAQATDPIGPCNANYNFECDDQGNCTCVAKGRAIEVLSWSFGASVFVGGAERLEILPNYEPEDASICEIDYAFSTRMLEGEVFGSQPPGVSGALNPKLISQRHATPPAQGGFVAFAVDAVAADCTWGEAQSLNVPYVIRNGNGAVSHRGSAKGKVTFPSLGGDALPPILPADSSLVPLLADETEG